MKKLIVLLLLMPAVCLAPPVPFAFWANQSASSATPPTTNMVGVLTVGTPRNNITANLGTKFIPQVNMTVTDLGRWVLSGNNQTHTIIFADQFCTSIETVTVNTSGATPGQFLYGHLATPLSLVAGTIYTLESSEVNSGDFWLNDDTTYTFTNPAAFNSDISVFGVNPGDCFVITGGNHMFVGVDLKYTVP